jgi:DNA-binding transcriptional MerR regulator
MYHWRMPTENDYTLQDLADLADVTPRTIRYYVAQGLLPSPGRVGPGATYGEGHLARLRLIRQLQRDHLPLAEIRSRLASLDDATVAELLAAAPPGPAPGSAAEYIRRVLEAPGLGSAPRPSAPPGWSPDQLTLVEPAARTGSMLRAVSIPLPASPPAPARPDLETAPADRSQWDRIVIVPDVELHVRRPLTRHLNKRVERLVAIARELLEEDQP